MAYMIYDNFKIRGTGEALLDFTDLLRVQLKNDNVQGFDTKWNELLLSMTKKSRCIDVGTLICKKQPQYSEEFKPPMALCLQETVPKEKRPDILD